MANEEVEKEKRELQMQRMKRHAGGRFVGSDEKANDFKGTLKRLLELLRPQLPLLILTVVMTIAYTVASTYAPMKLANMVNVITDGVRAREAGTGGIDFEFTATYGDGKSVKVPQMSNYFQNFIKCMLDFFRTGKVYADHKETIAIMAAIEAGNKALKTPGVWVEV